ncbi:MAG TPA: plastocyanin/azurin family copper-binding protein [bacterium]|nr:plastocyanin/azurin family copper-binding protein [bacterium]
MTSGTRAVLTAVGILLAGGVFFTAVSCNNSTASGGTACTQTITIDDFVFSPLNLSAKPGETVCVVNNDTSAHTVTSESAPDAFDDDGRFDSGLLNAGDDGSITVPATADAGEVIPYYCDVHLGAMVPPNGSITVSAP